MQTYPTPLPGPYDSYFGGKSGNGVAQTIINHIRPHDIYMELFLGNGSVFRHKRPASVSVLMDASRQVFSDWFDRLLSFRQSVELLHGDALAFLAAYPFDKTVRYCLCLDPPYPIRSRRAARAVYACELTDDDHRDLLRLVRYLPDNVDVLISTYENPIYADMLADWHLVTFRAMTRQGPATEYLYMNYVPDGRLHDYRYLGTDRTDRQRIRRKISREIARLQQLPPAERNAIVTAVSALASAASTSYPAAKPEPGTPDQPI
ncbi:DNA adenine methylase [Spirosoma sordidisoli]|uniref:DNA adenine methylase n=1 Tax=Spirosoma sordidisoli TaxID=2502893 RepID=A0A4Q2UKN0_9BACT|nr:DNA adenine methylase [Spirosoma sordidisoli]RYC70077.1 DNA adenine methylase [Spirosoma sordidisoli]